MKYLILIIALCLSGCTTMGAFFTGFSEGMNDYNKNNPNVQCTTNGQTLGNQYSGTTYCR